MKKSINTSNLKGQLSDSTFFSRDGKSDSEALQEPVVSEATPNSPDVNLDVSDDVNTDVMTDITTSSASPLLQGVNIKKWRELIEDTETQNSTIRLTRKERDEIEDLVSELKRKYKIKTSMNEVARLGLLLLIQDFKKNKTKSIVHEVKKS